MQISRDFKQPDGTTRTEEWEVSDWWIALPIVAIFFAGTIVGLILR